MARVIEINKDNKPVSINREELRKFISNASATSTVYVGCDSKRFRRGGRMRVAYVTVVVIHYDSCNGGKIFKEVEIQDDYGNMRQRLMTEVYMAANLAYEIVDVVGDRPFEVHLDLNPNPNHKSSVVVKEATGYVMGMLGITPKLKPHSIASSTCADKFAVSTAEERRDKRKGKKLRRVK